MSVASVNPEDRPSAELLEVPTWCAELDLLTGAEFRSLTHRPRQSHVARVLIRRNGTTLGYLTVGPHEDQSVEAVTTTAHSVFRLQLRATVDPAVTAPPMADVLVSVIVCTRDRADQLRACLEKLQQLPRQALEILVVDNAPSDNSTRSVVSEISSQDGRVRYLHEPVPGLSAARNTGLLHAAGEFVAYTDDDVAVDSNWVDAILCGFARDSRVACVTGLVCTASITTTAEAYFDARTTSWSTRVKPILFTGDATDHGSLYPYSPGIFGTGANFAFRTATLRMLGGFDEALGAGTLTRGGEDLDIFLRIITKDHYISYEPSAVVWHYHRADERTLLKQIYGYGTGLTACLFKCVLATDMRWPMIRRIAPGGVKLVRDRRQTQLRLGTEIEPPKRAAITEIKGYVSGPALYMRSRKRARHLRAVESAER